MREFPTERNAACRLAVSLLAIFRSAAVPAAACGNRKALETFDIRFEFHVLRVKTPALRSNQDITCRFDSVLTTDEHGFQLFSFCF